MNAKQLFNDLISQGFDKAQIADAMCDGSYLESEGIDQDTAEAVYDMCNEIPKRRSK